MYGSVLNSLQSLPSQGLNAGAATDVMITASLTYILYRMNFIQPKCKRFYYVPVPYPSPSLMHRIVALAMSAGAVTAVLALAALITFLTVNVSQGELNFYRSEFSTKDDAPLPGVSIPISWLLGRTYTCIILFTLLYRSSILKDASASNVQSSSLSTSSSPSLQKAYCLT